jgi:hypothetical protein
VDAARARTLAHCAVFIACETDDELVRGLQSVTKMIRTILTSAQTTEVAMIRNILAMRHATVFFAVYRPGHPRYNGLLEQVCDALESHIALPRTGGSAADFSQMMEPADGTIMAHTGMSRAFTTLLGTMDRCVRAEQPLQRAVAGDVRADPFGLAMQDAEAALTDMHAALHQLLAADLVRREDRALWETGYALWSLLSKTGDEERLFQFETLVKHQPRFMVPGAHAVARRTREMQAEFFSLAAELMRLEDFGGPGPDGDGACGPALAA